MRFRLMGGTLKHPAHANGQIIGTDVLLVLVNEQFYQPCALLFLALQQFLNLVGAQQPVFDEGVGNPFGK